MKTKAKIFLVGLLLAGTSTSLFAHPHHNLDHRKYKHEYKHHKKPIVVVKKHIKHKPKVIVVHKPMHKYKPHAVISLGYGFNIRF